VSGEAHEGRHGSGDEHYSLTLFLHHWHYVLEQQEVALDVNTHHRLPVVFGEILDRPLQPYARVTVQAINSPEGVERFINQLLDIFFHRDISLNESYLATGGCKFVGQCCACLRLVGGYCYFRPQFAEMPTARLANARGPPGDDYDLVLKVHSKITP